MADLKLSPALLEHICCYLINHGRNVEGIFRTSPNRGQLTALQNQLKNAKNESAISELFGESRTLDPCTVASLLKSVLTDVSPPILNSLANCALNEIAYSDLDPLEDEDSMLSLQVRRMFSSLEPDYHAAALSVISMLQQIKGFSSATRMGASQLSVIFAPVLFGCPEDHEGLRKFNRLTSLLQKLIENPGILCPKPLQHCSEDAWLAIVRSAIRDRLFPVQMQSTSDTATEKTSPTSKKAFDGTKAWSDSQQREEMQAGSRINISIDLVQSPVGNVLAKEPATFMPTISAEPELSSRSAQLTRIAGALCERFGIVNGSEQRTTGISPAEEKVALQRALLQLEGSFGRPVDKIERQIVRPLYERYRELKRLTASASNSGSRSHYSSHHPHSSDHHHRQALHQPRRHGKHTSSQKSGASNGSDVRWATPSGTKINGRTHISSVVSSIEDAEEATFEHSKADRRRGKGNNSRNELSASAELHSKTYEALQLAVEDCNHVDSNINDMKHQIALNSTIS